MMAYLSNQGLECAIIELIKMGRQEGGKDLNLYNADTKCISMNTYADGAAGISRFHFAKSKLETYFKSVNKIRYYFIYIRLNRWLNYSSWGCKRRSY